MGAGSEERGREGAILEPPLTQQRRPAPSWGLAGGAAGPARPCLLRAPFPEVPGGGMAGAARLVVPPHGIDLLVCIPGGCSLPSRGGGLSASVLSVVRGLGGVLVKEQGEIETRHRARQGLLLEVMEMAAVQSLVSGVGLPPKRVQILVYLSIMIRLAAFKPLLMVASQWRMVLKFRAVQRAVTESQKVPVFTLKSGRKSVREV